MNKLKLILFICFSMVIPCGYLIVKYGLFQPTTSLQVGLWGIIVIGIMLGVISVLIKYYLDSMKLKYTLCKQILSGVIKLILPLTLFLLVIIMLENNIVKIKEALIVIICCELVAIVVNPLPKYCFDNNLEGLGNIIEKIGLGKGVNK